MHDLKRIFYGTVKSNLPSTTEGAGRVGLLWGDQSKHGNMQNRDEVTVYGYWLGWDGTYGPLVARARLRQ
jgi:hypothetical protein